MAGVQGIDVGYHSFVYYHVRSLLFCKRALFRGRLSFGVDARQNFQHFIDGLCGVQHVGTVLDAAVVAGQAVLDFENQKAFVDQSVVFQEFAKFFFASMPERTCTVTSFPFPLDATGSSANTSCPN